MKLKELTVAQLLLLLVFVGASGRTYGPRPQLIELQEEYSIITTDVESEANMDSLITMMRSAKRIPGNNRLLSTSIDTLIIREVKGN